MAFAKKTWKDRVAEYINRRTLVKEDGTTEVVSVTRNEGTISQEGDAFSAETMNDLEQRIEDEFNGQNERIEECFRSGSEGKSLIAAAITAKKVATEATATFAEMAANIAKIVLGSGNAKPAHVLKGYTFTNDDGVQYTGTYDFAKETAGSAIASVVTSGYTFWVNGVKYTGTRPAIVTSKSGSFNYTIPANTRGQTFTIAVSFGVTFDKTPSVSVGCSKSTYLTISATSVTRTGFVYKIVSNWGNDGNEAVTCTWNAQG